MTSLCVCPGYQIFHVDAVLWPQADRLSEVNFHGIGILFAIIALVPAVLGSVLLARRSPADFAYLVFSLLIMITYPTGGSARMLLPVVPVLILVSYLGLERLLGWRAALGWTTCVVFANLFVCTTQADLQSGSPYGGEATADVMALIREEVPRETSPEDLLVTDYSLVVTGLLDRRAIPPESFSGADHKSGSVYLLGLRSRPIKVPENMSQQVIATHGEAQLSRLNEAR